LRDQARPAADGTMAVTLEVRNPADPSRPVAVQTWHYDDQTVSARNRLQANLSAGDHLVKAVILAPTGKPAEINAVLTVEPGQVVMKGGKVSLRSKQP
jgi:hypothetical protein